MYETMWSPPPVQIAPGATSDLYWKFHGNLLICFPNFANRHEFPIICISVMLLTDLPENFVEIRSWIFHNVAIRQTYRKKERQTDRQTDMPETDYPQVFQNVPCSMLDLSCHHILTVFSTTCHKGWRMRNANIPIPYSVVPEGYIRLLLIHIIHTV